MADLDAACVVIEMFEETSSTACGRTCPPDVYDQLEWGTEEGGLGTRAASRLISQTEQLRLASAPECSKRGVVRHHETDTIRDRLTAMANCLRVESSQLDQIVGSIRHVQELYASLDSFPISSATFPFNHF